MVGGYVHSATISLVFLLVAGPGASGRFPTPQHFGSLAILRIAATILRIEIFELKSRACRLPSRAPAAKGLSQTAQPGGPTRGPTIEFCQSAQPTGSAGGLSQRARPEGSTTGFSQGFQPKRSFRGLSQGLRPKVRARGFRERAQSGGAVVGAQPGGLNQKAQPEGSARMCQPRLSKCVMNFVRSCGRRPSLSRGHKYRVCSCGGAKASNAIRVWCVERGLVRKVVFQHTRTLGPSQSFESLLQPFELKSRACRLP